MYITNFRLTEMDENLIKKLRFRSLHRGCKETDILLGEFAKSGLAKLNDNELSSYQLFIEEDDEYIYKWLNGSLDVPEQYKELVGKVLGG